VQAYSYTGIVERIVVLSRAQKSANVLAYVAKVEI